MRLVSRQRKVGVFLVLVAFAPFVLAYWRANRYNPTPLDHRVTLHAGQIRTPEIDGRYILYLEVQPRIINPRRLDCLLDLPLSKHSQCDGIAAVVDISWTIWRGDLAVADNRSLESWKAGQFANDFTRREIGRFDAERGERYELTIDFHGDPSELNIAKPKLVAESMQDAKGYVVELELSFVLGVIVAATGLILLLTFRRSNSAPRTS